MRKFANNSPHSTRRHDAAERYSAHPWDFAGSEWLAVSLFVILGTALVEVDRRSPDPQLQVPTTHTSIIDEVEGITSATSSHGGDHDTPVTWP